MAYASAATNTEVIDRTLLDLDLRSNSDILRAFLSSQQRALDAVAQVETLLDDAVEAAALRLQDGNGRIVLAGAGASGRIAVQDGAELWPTFSWPGERLLCAMAGGDKALVSSVEGAEDDSEAAEIQVEKFNIGSQDVVVGVAASGTSAWTCSWLQTAAHRGALCIGIANNAQTPLLQIAHHPLLLDTGAEVLAGSTRMSAGTAQKIILNLFSTTLMIRLNRTYGNLMVDMGAVNNKLDTRRIRLLQTILPEVSEREAQECLVTAGGWIKLAVLIAAGDSEQLSRERLERCSGSLRIALKELGR